MAELGDMSAREYNEWKLFYRWEEKEREWQQKQADQRARARGRRR